jgi:cation diffusion facilitator CzcD-associated flavoprotein CzcO
LQVDTLIIGAGFSGLCMAMKLRAAGMNSFLVIEKSAGIGGTWWKSAIPAAHATSLRICTLSPSI